MQTSDAEKYLIYNQPKWRKEEKKKELLRRKNEIEKIMKKTPMEYLESLGEKTKERLVSVCLEKHILNEEIEADSEESEEEEEEMIEDNE